MATGALEREKYLRYLSQDAYFLFHFNRAYARALTKAEDVEEIAGSAVKELAIEGKLNDIANDWVVIGVADRCGKCFKPVRNNGGDNAVTFPICGNFTDQLGAFHTLDGTVLNVAADSTRGADSQLPRKLQAVFNRAFDLGGLAGADNDGR